MCSYALLMVFDSGQEILALVVSPLSYAVKDPAFLSAAAPAFDIHIFGVRVNRTEDRYKIHPPLHPPV